MIKFSTRLPFCTCFHPTWIEGKQQGSLGKLWLAETWKMVCCYWPYSHWCPLLNLNKVAILTHYFYNVTHFFQTWNLAQSDILPKWFSWKKNCVNTRPSSDFSRCHTKSPSQFHCGTTACWDAKQVMCFPRLVILPAHIKCSALC